MISTEREAKIVKVALAARVLAVAVINLDVGDWAAYIDAVPGLDHAAEAPEVGLHGNKLPKKIAEFLFSGIAKTYKWRE